MLFIQKTHSNCAKSSKGTYNVQVGLSNASIRNILSAKCCQHHKAVCNLLMLLKCSVANCIPLLIQQNINGSDFFNRSWAEFKVGFNDSSGNYWLGNELLSQLTVNGSYKLRFDLQSRSNGSWYYAEYSTFRILTEVDNYRLQVAGYSGNVGYDAFSYHNGTMFTTYDRDNDQSFAENCALLNSGGFWYNGCAFSVVNGAVGIGLGFHWQLRFFTPEHSDLQSSRMWLQCK